MAKVYKVIKPGFMFGRLYHPEGKRKTLVSAEPLKPVPDWLEEIKGGTDAKKRGAAKKKAARRSTKKVAKKKPT